jgi:hypothetical protein
VKSAIGDYTNAVAKVGRPATAYVATADPDLVCNRSDSGFCLRHGAYAVLY